MNIEISASGEIVLSCEELAKYARRRASLSPSAYRPAAAPYGDRDVFSSFSLTTIKSGEVFVVTCEPDGVFSFGKELIVEMKKDVRKLTPSSSPVTDAEFLAKAFCTAHVVAKSRQSDDVTLKVTLASGGVEKHFDFHLTADYLSKVFEGLLERAAFFAIAEKEFEFRGRHDIANMPFPYSSIRDGQVDFIKDAYRAISRGTRLLVSAPTGIGKTISALFPSVKAIGEGKIDKVFYLTAKTVTGQNAAKAIESMRKSAPDLRAIIINAKERVCPSNDKRIDFSIDRCSPTCPRVSDAEGGDYNTRRDRALKELLSSGGVYDRNIISAIAEKHFLCPYELSLDLSEYCAVVICDYNYVFDPSVKFRRYFSDGKIRYALLIDEAHNLPDRAREMFSSTLESKSILALKEALSASTSPDAALISKTAALLEAMEVVKVHCLENADASDTDAVGYTIDDAIPPKLFKAAEEFSRAAASFRYHSNDEDVTPAVERALDDARDFIKSAEHFDEHFVFFASLSKGELTCRAMCLDPSSILDRAMAGAVSTILFSATLTPLDYFADVTGCTGSAAVELESPYPEENLCVAAVDTVSTKYLAREDTAEAVAELICTTVGAKSGHYIVYFPSYKYMSAVFSAFSHLAPKGTRAVVQKQGMSLDARRKFLSFFESDDGGETLVGFCVLGGVFSEGIDLPDERLIGAILVGIGLPSLSSELNILKEYYDKTRENGYEFAYLYPAMIKTAQAAGRVIRSESDRGVIVLIDDRYAGREIVKLLPSHMQHLHYVGNAASLSKHLKDFWEK